MSHSLRKARIFLHIGRGMILAVMKYPRAGREGQQALIRDWSKTLLRLCGMTLIVHGDENSLAAGGLVVGNHVSWIDIYVINAWRPTPFVAKAEIAGWPVIGWLAKTIGTIFIQREKRGDARRIMQQLAERISGDERAFVFPEGTTGDGQGLLPFHSNLFQAAVIAGAPVQPVCLMYADASGRQTLAPAYVGDMSLMDTLNAMLDVEPLVVHLYIGEAIPVGLDRRALSARAEQMIGGALLALQRGGEPAKEWIPSDDGSVTAAETV
jgi:1-acyl-sn-glycerol-3-phosphate acyltransferase